MPSPINIKNLSPEDREEALQLFLDKKEKESGKDAKRQAKIIDPAHWTFKVITNAQGTTYLQAYNHACHGATKGLTFRGMTLPLVTGSIKGPGLYPESQSPYWMDELKAWEAKVGGQLTK